VGQIVTLSYRDVAVPSPSWHVLQTINVAGAATGGADFAPTQIGLMGKSYGPADTSPQNYDFAYLKVSSLSATGTQNVTLAVPAGSTPESLLPQGDDIAGQVRFQIKNGTGTLVGPDGTSASYFTTYEPKLPASLAGLTSLEVATTIDSTTGGVAYLHNLGVQYVKPGTRLAHDTNKADFAAGPVQNGVDLTTLPGEMTPTIGTGTIQTEEFNAPPASWAWSNNPPGTSSYSFTGGNAELNCVSVTDLWGAGTSAEKPRAVLYNGTLVTGDFELETKITFQGPRDVNRHQGLAIIQANTSAGATVDTKLDLTNMIVFGPYQPDGMRMMRADNNNFADFGPGGYTGLTYWLRLRKMGNVFTGYVSEDGVNYTQLDSYTLSHAMPSMYVGFSAKAWPGSNGTQTMDFDYLKITPYTTTGTFESRVLDLGTADTGAMLDSLGGNSADVQLQFRAANTEAALSSLPFIGPDGTAGTSYSGTYTGGLAGISGRYIQYRATLPIGTRLSDVSIISAAVSVLPFSKQDAMNAMKIGAK
jgi:hypothetical protein